MSEDAGPSARALNGGVSRPGKRVQRDERTTTGGDAEQTYKHRARDAEEMADLRQYGFRQASMSRGVEVRGSSGTLAFRAPSVFFRGGGWNRTTAYPAPERIRAAERWLGRLFET